MSLGSGMAMSPDLVVCVLRLLGEGGHLVSFLDTDSAFALSWFVDEVLTKDEADDGYWFYLIE